MSAIGRLAALLIQHSRPADAIKLLDFELSKAETGDLWSLWASAQGACGDLAQAERAYCRALELTPGHRQAITSLAALRWTQGRQEAPPPLSIGTSGEPSRDITAQQVALLASNGWIAEAHKAISSSRAIGGIDHAEALELEKILAANRREAPIANHQLFGVLDDSVVSSLQFSELSDPEEMKESFRQAVRWIEIETSSQCNRRCSYCPNHEYDRLRKNEFLDQQLYSRLLSDLREIDYNGWIKLVGNNEFFLHEENMGYLAEARKQLPSAQLQLFSNADVLTRKMLDRVSEHRLDRLLITLHTAPNQPYSDGDTLQRAHALAQKLGLTLLLRYFERDTQLGFTAVYRGISITIHNADFAKVGHDWATFFDERRHAPRLTPCSYPIRQLIFNYEGDSFMCCRTFKEAVPQTIEAGALTGHLGDSPSIFHLYANPAHLRWRRQLFTSAPKTGPCRECDGDEAHLIAAAQDFAQLRALWETKIRTE
jgi:hypothetical protein